MAISNYLKENSNEIFDEDVGIVEKRLSEAETVLMDIVSENEVNKFVTLQKEILRR